MHVAREQIRTSGFLIFAFVFEIRPILFPHTLLWGVQAMGKSPDLHAEVRAYYPVATSISILDIFST